MVHKKKPDVATTFLNYDLHGAAAAGNIGLVIYALNHGQPINACLGGLLPIHAAASGGSAEVVQLLIDQGADVNVPRLPSGTGPPIGVGGAGSMVGPNGIIDEHGHSQGEKLHKGRAGSSGGHSQPPVTPIRPGSSNTGSTIPIGRRGSTPLHFAAAMGHTDVVRLLLENGANPGARDVEKNTPEMVARVANKTRVADFIRDWQNNGTTIDGARRSFDSPIPTSATSQVPKPSGALPLVTNNGSTASLPSVSAPASQSTASLGRYPNSGRRPSLPSIYESPPSTSYPRPTSAKSKGEQGSPERPNTSMSMNQSALTKLPFTIRRPKSAGNRDRTGSDGDAASQHSHYSTKSGNIHGTASRLNRIFKRTNPNRRPATASGALPTPTASASPSPISPSPPVITRSRSPSASRISDKDHQRPTGGLFHGHHLPHLPRRDHPHHAAHGHHLQLQHVSRDAISGPITNGESPAISIPDIPRPDLIDIQQHTGTGPEMSTSPDELDEEEALYKALNLTPAEYQYAKTRGALTDRLKAQRTAPPSQTSFGVGKKASGSNLHRYPSHSTLNKPSASTLPSPNIVPRHRAHLGPKGNGTDSPSSFVSTGGDRSPAVRPMQTIPALQQIQNERPKETRQRGDGNGSISSLDSHLSGSSGNEDYLKSPEGMETKDRPSPFKPFVSSAPATSSHPSPSSPYMASPYSDYGSGMPYTADGRMISNRAQAQELVEAQKRAIEAEHRERVRTKRLASASSHRTGASHLAEARTLEPGTPFTDVTADLPPTAASSYPGDDSDVSLDEDDVNALREKLAALGETVQIERRFAKGEQQAKKWNRESGLDEDGLSSIEDAYAGVPASSMSASMLTRNEMLDGYLGKQPEPDKERVKRPTTPKRDVFGRPVTPQPKEKRPSTPKETRPGTPKGPTTPTTTRFVDAPRGNRIMPPAQPGQPSRSGTHLTLQQTRAISKSDLALGSHVNKDDLQGRERAWTTTEPRPRVGPTVPSRPSTAGAASTMNAPPSPSPARANPSIDVIQPTPTDGGISPLRKNSPGSTSSSPHGQQRESLQSRRRCSSSPLKIDAKTAQEKALARGSPDDNSMAKFSPIQPRQRTSSRPKKPSTPTKEQPGSSSLTRATPPTIAIAPPPDGTPFSSFLSVSSNGGQENVDNKVTPPPPAPVPALPSAVEIHNLHIAHSKERFIEAPQHVKPVVQQDMSSLGTWSHAPPSAAERRLGIALGAQNGFGYESVRSFNEEKGGDKSYRLLGLDGRESDTSPAGKKSKLGGIFSRLKR